MFFKTSLKFEHNAKRYLDRHSVEGALHNAINYHVHMTDVLSRYIKTFKSGRGNRRTNFSSVYTNGVQRGGRRPIDIVSQSLNQVGGPVTEGHSLRLKHTHHSFFCVKSNEGSVVGGLVAGL